jgi:dTDP-4-dehydrorhamnose reductase
MTILIIGSNGQLGRDLMQTAQDCGQPAMGTDLPHCDITDPDSIRQTLDAADQLAVVINAAAYTAVDEAESKPDLANAVNRDGPGLLAQACRQQAVPLIHVSTDYVFQGLKTSPYLPSDAVAPTGVYGQSKAAGEAAVRSHLPEHVIVRTSWLFGLHGPNFVKTMLRLGRERDELRVVDDQVGCPTYAGDLAQALLDVADFIAQRRSGWGTYHFCNVGPLTWYAFARRIFALARPYERFAVKQIWPILAAHYPLPAPRPHYSVLDCTSFEETFGVIRRPWEDALKEMLAELYASNR